MDQLAQNIIRRFFSLYTSAQKWRGIWEDCARYCEPNDAPIKELGTNTDGARKKQPLDTTGIEAASKLAAWLYSSTIFQGEQWFSLRAKKKGFRIDTPLQKFLEEAARTALNTISTSNCIKIYQQFLRSYVNYGTGIFYSEFDDAGNLICRHFKITNDVAVAENSKGEIDTVFRRFQYSARQAVQEFGKENLSADIINAANDEKNQDKLFTFIHAVYPRIKRNKDKKTADNKPFASVYVEVDKASVVVEGGYDTFPYCVPRFYNTGEVYGRSPAMSALPSLRAINIAVYFYLKNIEFNSKPMVFTAPEDLDKINIAPGAKNPKNPLGTGVDIWSPSGDINSPLQFVERKTAEVQSMFYNDVFQYLEDRKNMTATEAQLRYDEMVQGVAPVLANLHQEFFTPFIRRVVYALIEKEIISVPNILKDKDGSFKDFDVVYTTRLDTKLKGVLNANILNTYRILGEIDAIRANSPLAQTFLSDEETVKLVCANNDTSADLLNDEETIKQIKQAQSEQAQSAALQGMIDKINLQKTPEKGSAQDIMINSL